MAVLLRLGHSYPRPCVIAICYLIGIPNTVLLEILITTENFSIYYCVPTRLSGMLHSDSHPTTDCAMCAENKDETQDVNLLCCWFIQMV